MTLASIGMASSSACDAKQNVYKGYRLVVTIMCQSEHVHVSQKYAGLETEVTLRHKYAHSGRHSRFLPLKR